MGVLAAFTELANLQVHGIDTNYDTRDLPSVLNSENLPCKITHLDDTFNEAGRPEGFDDSRAQLRVYVSVRLILSDAGAALSGERMLVVLQYLDRWFQALQGNWLLGDNLTSPLVVDAMRHGLVDWKGQFFIGSHLRCVLPIRATFVPVPQPDPPAPIMVPTTVTIPAIPPLTDERARFSFSVANSGGNSAIWWRTGDAFVGDIDLPPPMFQITWSSSSNVLVLVAVGAPAFNDFFRDNQSLAFYIGWADSEGHYRVSQFPFRLLEAFSGSALRLPADAQMEAWWNALEVGDEVTVACGMEGAT